MEIISSIAGFLGFLLSLILAVREYKKSKVDLDFGVINHFTGEKRLEIFCYFVNNSQLPIALTDIKLHVADENINCDKFPKHVLETGTVRNEEKQNVQNFFSFSFPIILDPLGGASGYILFGIPKSRLGTLPIQVVLEVATNRDSTLKKKLWLPHPDNLESVF